MDIKIYPGKLQGTVSAIPSKSQAHRLLICAAFSDTVTNLLCSEANQDIEATVGCLRALGAEITRSEYGYQVYPVKQIPRHAELDCGESGSTLRFLLPIVCALGIKATFYMHGRLPYRPLSPLWEELERMGCNLCRPTETTICTKGRLHAGEYKIAGNVSSQFVSGLLFALALMDGESKIHITDDLESRPYVDMTQQALANFGVATNDFVVRGSYPFHSPGTLTIEGDWSNGAFFLTAKSLDSQLQILNLDRNSAQGDRAVEEILQYEEPMPTISAANIPDLVPILAVYFAAMNGAVFQDICRLRIKESDRVLAVSRLLQALGISVESDETTLTVHGGIIHGGIVDACNDHRIAMAAAIAATVADGPVTILGAECVAKSYPSFWLEYRRLGGNYEQYIR